MYCADSAVKTGVNNLLTKIKPTDSGEIHAATQSSFLASGEDNTYKGTCTGFILHPKRKKLCDMTKNENIIYFMEETKSIFMIRAIIGEFFF